MHLIRKNKMNLAVSYLIFREINGVAAFSVFKKIDDEKIMFVRFINGTFPMQFIKQQMTALKLVFAGPGDVIVASV